MVQKIGKHLHSFCILTALFPPAKFLSKAGKIQQTKVEENVANEKETVRKLQECIEICQRLVLKNPHFTYCS